MKEKLSRRRFLRGLGTLAAGSALAACAPQTVVVEKEVQVEKVVTKEVEKVVKETVIVEGTPQVVEKTVKETVVVEVAPPTAEELLQNLPDKLGSPDHARGWKTILPELPTGYPLAEPVVINCTRRVDQQTSFCEGDDMDDNPWSRMIKELFNVEYRTAWTWSTGDEANQKYNLAMASGDMPDFLETVPLSIFVQMVEADLLEDLTDAYDAYASPRWKEIWREYGDLPWTWSRIDGRIYGLPRVEDLAHNDCILWYREDWLEKVGMSVPTTIDELHDVALAFKEADLGLGAAGTTIGLLASESYSNTWYGSLDSIWGGYGYIPFHWQPEGDDLMYGAIRPEIKEALAVLNQWYNEGIFRQDFYTLTTSQALADVSSASCGLHFTPSWGANRDTVINDPECVWKFADIPTGPKGFKRRHTENNFRESPFAFRKGFEHIKEVFDVTDWWDQLWHDAWRRMHGWEGCNYAWEDDKVVPTGTSFQNWTPGPVGTRGSGFLDPKTPATNYRYQLDEWGKIPPEERDAQQELFFDDPTGVAITGAYSRLFILDTANEGVMTQFQSLPTPTMIERGVDLNKLRDENLIGFITGEKPLSGFDAFAEQWLNLGGAQMTDEVNEWWHSR